MHRPNHGIPMSPLRGLYPVFCEACIQCSASRRSNQDERLGKQDIQSEIKISTIHSTDGREEDSSYSLQVERKIACTNPLKVRTIETQQETEFAGALRLRTYLIMRLGHTHSGERRRVVPFPVFFHCETGRIDPVRKTYSEFTRTTCKRPCFYATWQFEYRDIPILVGSSGCRGVGYYC
jgi:hypothetical protein